MFRAGVGEPHGPDLGEGLQAHVPALLGQLLGLADDDEPTRQMMAPRSGKMPTIFVRLRISLLRRSLRVGAPDLAPEFSCGSAGKRASRSGLPRGAR